MTRSSWTILIPSSFLHLWFVNFGKSEYMLVWDSLNPELKDAKCYRNHDIRSILYTHARMFYPSSQLSMQLSLVLACSPASTATLTLTGGRGRFFFLVFTIKSVKSGEKWRGGHRVDMQYTGTSGKEMAEVYAWWLVKELTFRVTWWRNWVNIEDYTKWQTVLCVIYSL